MLSRHYTTDTRTVNPLKDTVIFFLLTKILSFLFFGNGCFIINLSMDGLVNTCVKLSGDEVKNWKEIKEKAFCLRIVIACRF